MLVSQTDFSCIQRSRSERLGGCRGVGVVVGDPTAFLVGVAVLVGDM